MINHNLIGFEDAYYCNYQRPKELRIHKIKLDQIENRKNYSKLNSVNSYILNNSSICIENDINNKLDKLNKGNKGNKINYNLSLGKKIII
jgi:hypothetical protein